MKRSLSGAGLALSLALNGLAAVAVVRSFKARGGWEYVRTRLTGFAESSANPDAANYAHRQSLFQLLPKRTGTLVFAGDSLTQGCEWGEFYPGAINRGIGGDTSVGLLHRISTITELQPRAVFLMIGSNDLFNLHLRPEQSVANVQAIVAQVRQSSPATPVFIQSILPTWRVKENIQSRNVNQGLRSLADGKHVFFLNFYSAFLKGELLDPELTSDGLHLNGQGYARWKQLLDDHVQPFVGNRASERETE
jgi:lysophospholipase L1-like esterase